MSSVIKFRGRDWDGLRKGIVIVDSLIPIPETVEEPEPLSSEEIARQMVLDAETKAREIIRDAQAQAAGIQEEARKSGFAQGSEEAQARWDAEFKKLQETAEELQREHEEMLDAAEPELAKLSLEIARKILKQELTQNPETVLPVVRSAIHRIKEKQVRILVNPKDLQIVRDARESLLSIADGVTEMEIVSDRRVGQGGCVVETPGGNLDARLETQLSHIGEIISKGYEDQQETA